MMRFLSFCVLAACAVTLPRFAAAANLEVTDLGPRGFGTPFQSPVINDQGQVAGLTVTPEGTVPFIWQDGVMTALPILPGATRVDVTGINSSGQVIGYSDAADGNTYAVTWNGGVISKLPTIDGKTAYAFCVNDAGLIVGAIGDNYNSLRPVLWDGDTITDLGAASGTAAFGINNAGIITGGVASWNSNTAVGFLWQDGTLTDLGSQNVSVGTAINDDGVVVGIVRVLNSFHAMTYQDGIVNDLGPAPGGPASIATAINDLGQVIGTGDGNGAYPFIWQDGQMTSLRSLLPPDTEWELFGGVTDLNNRGQIVGAAVNFNEAYRYRLVMLTIPEPSTFLLLCLGAAAVACTRTRGRR